MGDVFASSPSPGSDSVGYNVVLSLASCVATLLGFLPLAALLVTRDIKKAVKMFSVGTLWAAVINGVIWIGFSSILLKTEKCLELVLGFPMSLCSNFIYLILIHGHSQDYLLVGILCLVSVPSIAWSFFAVRLAYSPSKSIRNIFGWFSLLSLIGTHSTIMVDLNSVSGCVEFLFAFANVLPNGIMNVAVVYESLNQNKGFFYQSLSETKELNFLIISAAAGIVLGISELIMLLLKLLDDIKRRRRRNGGQGVAPSPPPPPPSPSFPLLGDHMGPVARNGNNFVTVSDDSDDTDVNGLPDSANQLKIVIHNNGDFNGSVRCLDCTEHTADFGVLPRRKGVPDQQFTGIGPAHPRKEHFTDDDVDLGMLPGTKGVQDQEFAGIVPVPPTKESSSTVLEHTTHVDSCKLSQSKGFTVQKDAEIVSVSPSRGFTFKDADIAPVSPSRCFTLKAESDIVLVSPSRDDTFTVHEVNFPGTHKRKDVAAILTPPDKGHSSSFSVASFLHPLKRIFTRNEVSKKEFHLIKQKGKDESHQGSDKENNLRHLKSGNIFPRRRRTASKRLDLA